MREASMILRKPVLTEKASKLKKDKKYIFEVAVNSNKIEVKNAVEKMYKVEVEKVNMSIMNPKKKRFRTYVGFSKAWKKAVVTLKKGEIDFYK